MSDNIKICRTCGEGKPLPAFQKDNKYYRPDCKACRNLKMAEYREKNRERVNENQRRYLRRKREERRYRPVWTP